MLRRYHPRFVRPCRCDDVFLHPLSRAAAWKCVIRGLHCGSCRGWHRQLPSRTRWPPPLGILFSPPSRACMVTDLACIHQSRQLPRDRGRTHAAAGGGGVDRAPWLATMSFSHTRSHRTRNNNNGLAVIIIICPAIHGSSLRRRSSCCFDDELAGFSSPDRDACSSRRSNKLRVDRLAWSLERKMGISSAVIVGPQVARIPHAIFHVTLSCRATALTIPASESDG